MSTPSASNIPAEGKISPLPPSVKDSKEGEGWSVGRCDLDHFTVLDEHSRWLAVMTTHEKANAIVIAHNASLASLGARLKGEGEPRSIIIELVAAMHRYEMNVDESPPFEHQQMIRRAEAFLSESSENTSEGKGEAPSGDEHTCETEFRRNRDFDPLALSSVSPNVAGASAEEKETPSGGT